MEEVTNLQANGNTVTQVLDIVKTAAPGSLGQELRDFAEMLIGTGYSNAQLYADLLNAYTRISGVVDEEQEDAVLDVMDFLTGWCAPDARIY